MTPTLGTARRPSTVASARPAVRPAIAALPAYKPGRNPADLAREIGVDRAVKLASNEVAFPPLPAVVQAIATAAAETNRYPDNGAVVLTAALAEHYDVDPARVVTGCGAVMLCQQLAQAYTEPGTSLAFAWRSFEMYPLLAQVAGARAVQVPLKPGRAGGPTWPCCGRSPRPGDSPACGSATSSPRTRPWPRRCARPTCRSACRP